MFSSFKRFGSIIVFALAACASAVATCISLAVTFAASGVVHAFDALTRIVVSAANRLPSATPKRPISTATERQHLVPSATYARKQDARRRPTILPSWRMCTSV
ncbi:MAG TPA: hypothetical protein VGE36_13685 [Roseateles sp.]